MTQSSRERNIFIAFIITLISVIYLLNPVNVSAQKSVNLPSTITLKVGEHVNDNERQCYILFRSSKWMEHPTTHPVITDWCQYAVLQCRDYREGVILSNLPYDVELCDTNSFYFCGYDVDLTFLNDTYIKLDFTER